MKTTNKLLISVTLVFLLLGGTVAFGQLKPLPALPSVPQVAPSSPTLRSQGFQFRQVPRHQLDPLRQHQRLLEQTRQQQFWLQQQLERQRQFQDRTRRAIQPWGAIRR